MVRTFFGMAIVDMSLSNITVSFVESTRCSSKAQINEKIDQSCIMHFQSDSMYAFMHFIRIQCIYELNIVQWRETCTRFGPSH